MMKRRLVVLTLCVAGGEANGGTGGSTSVTDSLNGMIQGGDPKNGVYVTGKGVLVRAMLDGLENGNNQGLPTTLWSNDIYAVSQMYPDRVDLFGWDNIYDFSTVGFVVGSAMPNLFFDFDSIQTQTWGWGVFYAHDSNCMDLRCRWLESDQIYDCPGGYYPVGRTVDIGRDKGGCGWLSRGQPLREQKLGWRHRVPRGHDETRHRPAESEGRVGSEPRGRQGLSVQLPFQRGLESVGDSLRPER